MSDTLTITSDSVALTSDSEFDLMKRVQFTNEVPSLSLYSLMPTGLQNAFWKYFMGTSTVEHEVPTTGTGGTIDSQVMKVVNGVVASDYGPPAEEGTTYTSMDIEGVLQPELDLFLHEIYRYLDHLYPDHPDYEYLLTPVELNDAFYAAAAIIGYVPDYKFLEMWSKSITGTALTREALKWKIRDLRSAAFRRKFAGSYFGYKSIFSTMYRHGAVYPTATYLPRNISNTLDVTSGNLFRMFRLIDFQGANNDAYETVSTVSFLGLIDPSQLLSIYEAAAVPITNDTSVIPKVSFGAFIQDSELKLVPVIHGATGITVQSKTTVETESEVASGFNANYTIHTLGLSSVCKPSVREYTVTHNGIVQSATMSFTPRPYGTIGNFSVPLDHALEMYVSDALPLTPVSEIPFGDGTLAIGDVIRDDYIFNGVYPLYDTAKVQSLTSGTIKIVTNPSNPPIITTVPDPTVLSGGLNIQIAQYDESGVVYSHVFLEGTLAYTLGTGTALSSAILTIYNIPEINPITGETNNRELIADAEGNSVITIGNYADICAYDEVSQAWASVPSTYGWIDAIDWGYFTAQETSRDGIPLAAATDFTGDSFTSWKKRAAAEFLVTMVPTILGTISGTISEDTPTEIDIITGANDTITSEILTAGDLIYGPGLQQGTIVVSSSPSSITITPPAIRFGSFTYNVTMQHSNGASAQSKIFDFKKDLYTRYPALVSSAFQFLWPATTWPDVSQGYLEGVSDTSLYSYPVELPPGTKYPSNVYIDRNIFLDLSLDRILYHPNTLGLTSATGQYSCLCDIPWLDYIEAAAKKFRRATEQVYVGVQLNLTTDTSGLYSVISGNSYSDETIQAKFTTLPQNYKNNPVPGYIQIGTGEGSSSSLFVSVDDLVRPTIYGSAFYDIVGRDEEATEKRRSTYLSANSSTVTTGTASTDTELVTPLFEVPIGEYENILGAATTNTDGSISYTSGLASSDNPDNTYHVIHTSIYAQDFKNIPLSLGANALILNSPATVDIKRLPEPWTFIGPWTPSTAPITTDGAELTPNWPTGTFNDKDYYTVSQTATIGTYTFEEGDWIVYNAATSSWVRKTWVLQGALTPPLNSTVVAPPNLSSMTSFANVFPYYLVTDPCTILGVGAADVGDWLIAASGTPANPSWVLTSGQAYDTLRTTVSKSILSTDAYTTLSQAYAENLQNTMFTHQLPRKYLATGSCNFQFKVNPNYSAVDANGVLYNLTNGPILYNSTEKVFYVEDTDLDEFAIRVQDSYGTISVDSFMVGNAHEDPSEWITFLVQSSLEPVNHPVKFREPKYFKNLGVVIGEVTASNELSMVSTDFDFPISKISQTDRIVSGLKVQLRNNFSSEYENVYFSHYVPLQGMLSLYDATNKTLIAVTGTDTDSTFAAEFSAALSHLSVGDKVQISQPAVARQYEAEYETTYFKNLLAIAGKVSSSDPKTLRPIGSTSDDLRAFSDAINLLSIGDYTTGAFVLGGSVYKTSSTTLPFTSNSSGYYALTVASNQGSSLLWISAGVKGQFAKSTDGLNWTLINFPAWGTGTIRKVVFAVMHDGSGQWRIVGDGGKCAYSLDNGATWVIDPLDYAYGSWGPVNINDISYQPNATATSGRWMIVGDNGQVAYLPADLATISTHWVSTALPGGDGVSITAPAGAPAGSPTTAYTSGWGTIPVRAVANGNQVWIVGGGNNTTGAGGATVGLLARCTNLTPATGVAAWNFVYLGSTWGNNYVASLAYGDGTWVVTGINGQVAYSLNDGASWTSVTLPAAWGTSNVNDVKYEYGVWTIVGDAGKIATATTDITSWTMGTASLGTTNLRASAHGASAANGMEHVIVGDTNAIAYSTSDSLTAMTSVAQTFAVSTMSITFDTDLVTWASGDPATKTVLITMYTKQSVECELIGVPTDTFSQFSLDEESLILPTAVITPSYTTANRVYYPRLNSTFRQNNTLGSTILAGYPLYSEDPTLYYADSSSNPLEYTNSRDHTIYLCDAFGNYVTSQYEAISISSFVNYVSADITTFSDSRQASYTPRFSTYAQWISSEGRLIPGTATMGLNLNTVAAITASTIKFTKAITLPAGNNIVIMTLMPTQISGTVSGCDTPAYGSTPYVANNLVTGIYLPDGGYGTWMGYDHTNAGAPLPWVGDTSAFSNTLLVNSNGSPVYLCNKDGTFRTDSLGNPIQMYAPIYFSFQELVTNLGREIDQETLNIDDIAVIRTNADNNVITFSEDLPVSSGYVRLHMLTLASFDPDVTKPNDPRCIYSIPNIELDQYTPDRVYYAESAYPSYADRPDLYLNGEYTNANSTKIHYCDSEGNYVVSSYVSQSKTGVAGSSDQIVALTDRISPQTPKYRLCQDWYMEEQYLESTESNPYWQYIILKDTFDQNSKTWIQTARMSHLRKSATGTQMVFEEITDSSEYFTMQEGLQFYSGVSSFTIKEVNYIDHKTGLITLLVLGNPGYDDTWRAAHGLGPVESTFEQYGIPFISNFELANISSSTEIIHSLVSSSLTSSFSVNTTKNFANTQDKKSSIVAVREMGVFNTDGDMIAYATFPPIIYDSDRHHLSLNLFIKQGEFSST